MQDRPVSVTIVGWVLVLLGLLGAVGVYMTSDIPDAERNMALSSLSPSAERIIGLAGVAISVICGLAVLKRQNWARWLYVIWNVAAIGLALFTSPATSLLLVPVAILAVTAFFLFWKPANAWFAGAPAASAL